MATDRILLTFTETGPTSGARLPGRHGAYYISGSRISIRLSTSPPNEVGLIHSEDAGTTWPDDHSTTVLSATNYEIAKSSGASYVAYRAQSSQMQTSTYDGSVWGSVDTTAITESTANVNGIVDGGFKAIFRNSTAGTHDLYYFSGGEEVILSDVPATWGTLAASQFGIELDEDGFPHVYFSAQNSPARSTLDTIFHSHRRSGSWSSPVAVKTDIAQDHSFQLSTSLTSGDGDGKIYMPIQAIDAGGTNERLYWCTYDIVGASWSDEIVDSDFISSGSSLAAQIDSEGKAFILALGVIASETAFEQIYLFSKPSGGSWSYERVAASERDVGSITATISNGNRGTRVFQGAFWSVRADWDAGSVSDYFVKKDLVLEDPGSGGSPDDGSVEVVTDIPSDESKVQRIPFDIPTTDARQVLEPEAIDGRPVEDQVRAIHAYSRHLYEFLRKTPDDLRSSISTIAEALPGDRRDAFDFVASGDALKEVTLVHRLGYEPTSMVVISKSGYGDVIYSRDKLGDVENVYVATSCPAGTRIRIRVY